MWFLSCVVLQIYTPALEDELGRLAVHNWVGIMREIKRSADDYGITCEWKSLPEHVCARTSDFIAARGRQIALHCFVAVPMDLDVRVKATLLGAVFFLVSRFIAPND